MTTDEQLSTFDEVNVFFDRAADRLGLPDGVRDLLRRPWRELRVSVPVRMDDGSIQVFSGYRIQHNGVRDRTRAACGTTPMPTRRRCAPSRR